MSSTSSVSKRFRTTRTQTSISGPTQVESTSTLVFTNNTFVDTLTKAGSLPHYRKIISDGGCATTPMSGTLNELNVGSGYAKYYQTRQKGSFANFPDLTYIASGDFFNVTPTSVPLNTVDTTVASNKALSNYYAHVAQVETSFKGMVFTGELRESLRMIRSPAKALRNGISHYLSFLKKRGPMVPKHRRPSFVRETWLEYSFGWKPLIDDIDSGIKTFYGGPFIRPILQMCSGKANNAVVSFSAFSSPTFGPLTWRYRVKHTEDYFVRYYGVYRSTGRGAPESVHRYGFNPAEFIPTLWELIPYSFLVDYFTNIGDIVSSWSYRFLAGPWTSKLRRRTHSYVSVDASLVAAPPPDEFWRYEVTGSLGNAGFARTTFVRDDNVGTPLPSFEVQVPGYGSVKWINILALSKALSSTRKVLAR